MRGIRSRSTGIYAFLSLVVVAIMMLGLVGCGAAATATPAPAATAAPAPTEAPAATQAPAATEAPAATAAPAGNKSLSDQATPPDEIWKKVQKAVADAQPAPGDPVKAPRKWEGVTLTAAVMNWPPSDAMRAVTPEWEKLTGAKVDIQGFPYETHRPKMLQEAVAHSGAFDLLAVDSPFTSEFATNGYIIDLTPYIKRDGMDLSDFLPACFEADSGWPGWDGKIWAMPLNSDSLIIYYRKDLWEKSGFKEIPATWDEYEAAATKITQDNNGQIYGTALMGSRGEGPFYEYLNRLWPLGGHLFDADMKPAFGDDAGLKALDMMVKQFTEWKNSPPGAVNYQFDDVVTALQQGKIASALLWSSTQANVVDATKTSVSPDKFGFAISPGGAGVRSLGVGGGGHGLGIATDSKNKEAAWDYLHWLFSPEQTLKMAQAGNAAPSTYSAYKDPELVKKFPGYPATEESMKYVVAPDVPQVAELQEVMSVAFSKAFTGQASTKDALQEAVDGVYKVMEKAGYYKK